MTPWEVLGLPEGSSPDEVKRAWRTLARAHHPDRNPDDPEAEARFKRLQAAYEEVKEGGPGGPVQSTARGPSDDWLDVLAWMAEHRAATVLAEVIPPYVAAHGTGTSLGWALRSALERGDLEQGAPEVPVGRWLRWRLGRRLRRVQVVVATPRWSRGMVSLQRTHGGVDVILDGRAFWHEVPHDEDVLRAAVARGVELALAGAVSMALKVPPVPPSAEAAAEVDRRIRADRLLWRGVWAGVTVLGLAMLVNAWLT